MAYAPTQEDIRWMKNMIALLNMDGVWGYKDKPITFKKTGHRTLTLVSAPFDDPAVNEQIERNKAVMARAGIEFVDGRGR